MHDSDGLKWVMYLKGKLVATLIGIYVVSYECDLFH